MATYSGIRVDNDFATLAAKLTLQAENVPLAIEDAMLAAAETATQVMEKRIIGAETNTGRDRARIHGGQPGRIKSGAMIASLRDSSGQAATVSNKTTRTGRIQITFGYNNDAPKYTEKQEINLYSLSGALLARQFGFNYFMAHIFDMLGVALQQAGDDAAAGRAFRRRNAVMTRTQSIPTLSEI